MNDFSTLDLYTRPTDGRSPDFHLITLAGDEGKLKLQEAATIVVTKFAYTIISKYRHLKDIVHGELGMFYVKVFFDKMNNIHFQIQMIHSSPTTSRIHFQQ